MLDGNGEGFYSTNTDLEDPTSLIFRPIRMPSNSLYHSFASLLVYPDGEKFND